MFQKKYYIIFEILLAAVKKNYKYSNIFVRIYLKHTKIFLLTLINSVKKIANCYPIIETSTVIERSRVAESSLNLNNTRYGLCI